MVMKLKNSKSQMVIQLQKSNCDRTQKHKLWQNSKTQIVTKLKLWRKKLKKSKCHKTQIVPNLRTQIKYQNSKTQIVTKLKNLNCVKNASFNETQIVMKFENSICAETQKLKLWQNWYCDKTHIATKLKNSNYDKTQKLKLWQNPKTQIVTKPKIRKI